MAEAREAGQIIPAGGPSIASTQSCTVEMVPRHLRIHSVSEVEIDALAAGSTSVHLTFFGVCFGAAVSFSIVLATTTLPSSNKALFATLFFSSVLMGVYFGVQGIRDYKASKKRLRSIKGERST